jgi:Ca2+-binding RTX toxin-like protein
MFRNIGQKFVSYTPLEQANNVAQKAEQPVQENIIIPELKNSVQTDVPSTSIRAEMQIGGMSMQTILNKNLDWKLGLAELPIQKAESAALKPIREQLKPVPTEIYTGAADDKVEINKGTDNLVHVNVNGTEVWCGTENQFRRFRIDTGDGDDQVINSVNGAKIFTGAGNDNVNNVANNASIDTGDGSDEVESKGSSNIIDTGRGDDVVKNRGTSNVIRTGSGGDWVNSRGDLNQVELGDGADYFHSFGEENTISGGRGNDSITVRGDDNQVFGNENDDDVQLWGDRNFADVGEGTDKATSMYGSDSEIVDPDK